MDIAVSDVKSLPFSGERGSRGTTEEAARTIDNARFDSAADQLRIRR